MLLLTAILSGLTLLTIVFTARAWLRTNGQTLIRLDAIETELTIFRLRVRDALARGDRVELAPGTSNDVGDSSSSTDSLRKSRINRHGLAEGTAAPPFSLPGLDSIAPVTLDEQLGESFVLVLASTNCGPCDVVMRELSQLSPPLSRRVVAIVRGEPSEIRQKLNGLAPQFSIAYEESWQTFIAYGTLSFPSAYLISAEGMIRGPRAVGPDEISTLLDKLRSAITISTSVA